MLKQQVTLDPSMNNLLEKQLSISLQQWNILHNYMTEFPVDGTLFRRSYTNNPKQEPINGLLSQDKTPNIF